MEHIFYILIISNDISNKYLNRVQVIPLISNTNKLYPSETIIDLNRKSGKAMADQITTVCKLQVFNKIGVPLFCLKRSIKS